MQAGLLTDGIPAERVRNLAEDGRRSRSMDFQAPLLERNLALRDAFRPVAKRHGVTVAAVAVAWILSWKGLADFRQLQN